ncbi:ABC transporter permease [Rhodococcus sp. BP-252]|nr:MULTISPECIES: FtsX-like permease family protein [unclassified Rhodococcus (in: high G+C Gram-positive bacteria)]MBY6414718.1 ABC transporter permease [Rhodococcus sp. BP-320]MBY6419622.1 ABC transporter permease [Rhodococcus sp. BP-321]MBY6424603.1 ABC transporter permease [Rhodococcus sp. BP-324]MBY6429600.1 ABC transporter permease [Rhodococcus sp. BP-323]MBY6434568.1 ABC transporter permease [Rhodococcus sp. BP-322]
MSRTHNPMRKVSLRNLAAHKVRLALTVLSVVLGTAFVSGSFVFTDTLQRTFSSIFSDTAQGADVRVSAQEAGSSGVPVSDANVIAALPNVRAVAPYVGGQVVLLGKDGAAVQTGGAPTVGEAYLADDRRLGDPAVFVAGTAPTAPGQVVVNEGGATRSGLTVGDATQVLVPSKGTVDVTIVGIYDTPVESGGYIGLQFYEPQADELFTDGTHVQYYDVAGGDTAGNDLAAQGLTQSDLRDEIAAALPDLKVQTADDVRDEAQAQVETALSFVNYFLLAFGGIALLVGTFIIYNTFSMIVAQRVRELALLRAIGASRGQVSRSVVLEALVVGIIGSALGFAGGVGLAYGLRELLNAFDLGLPSGTLALEPRTVIVAFAVGIVVTVLSAYAPARRAANIPPVAAMREEFASTGDSLRVRTVVGAVLGVLGLLALVVGAQSAGGGAAATVGVGAVAVIVAVALAAPSLSRPIVGALGAVLTRPFGAIGRLARTNSVRNPRRTAATAFALMLGLMLVSVIGVLGSTAKASVDALVDNGIEADYIFSGPPSIGVPTGAGRAARDVPGVERVAILHPVSVKIDDEQAFGVALEGSPDGLFDQSVVAGSGEQTPNSIGVSESASRNNDWPLGSTIDMVSLDGKSVSVEVTTIFADNPLVGDWILSDDVYQAVTPGVVRSDIAVLIGAAPGTDLGQLRADLENAVKPFVVVQVQDREEFKGAQSQQIDTLLAVLYGLLALAVVIAILGIVNTLALSVVERRREIGMLRAVGMQRPQVRRTIYLESMLIALFGAIVGLILGVVFGWGFVRTLRDEGLGVLTIPWGQMVGMLVGSAVVGIGAALLPAIRAARTRPLEVISEA